MSRTKLLVITALIGLLFAAFFTYALYRLDQIATNTTEGLDRTKSYPDLFEKEPRQPLEKINYRPVIPFKQGIASTQAINQGQTSFRHQMAIGNLAQISGQTPLPDHSPTTPKGVFLASKGETPPQGRGEEGRRD